MLEDQQGTRQESMKMVDRWTVRVCQLNMTTTTRSCLTLDHLHDIYTICRQDTQCQVRPVDTCIYIQNTLLYLSGRIYEHE